ncbi:MAG: DUF2625 family protein [Myxococcales bacterium]|nr:DUF2625 family protein [Myxococcales bacterium]
MRGLEELVDRSEPGIALVREWMTTAKRPVELLPCVPEDGQRTLLDLQVTTRSPMGALAYETGGLLVDDGWVRVLGAGCARLPRTITRWNGIGGPHRLPGAILVGDDALGGFFAIDGGRFGGAHGGVFYGAPDTLEWEALDMSYSAWLGWLFEGDLDGFYGEDRWPRWRDEVRSLGGDRAFLVYPFLFCEGPPTAERSRGDVPIEELWGLLMGGRPE